jgi:hypothetical protein
MESKSSQIPALVPGLFLLLMIAACSISIGGWGSSSSTWIQGPGSITYTSNGESIRANVVGKEVQIAVLRNGKLSGVDGMSAAQRKILRGLTSHGRKYVDHPRLPAWQQQLMTVNALALEQDTTAKALADSAKGLPFDGLIDDAVTKWVRDDPKRACAMLDLAAELKPGRDTSHKLLGLALQSDAVDDNRVTSWLTAKVIYKDPKAIKIIAASKAVGPKAAEQILRNLDEVYGSERKEIYIAAGRHLVGDIAQARVLVSKLNDLYGSHRMDAALALLQEPGACTEYPIQLLENIDDFYGNNRLRVYLAAGQKAITDVRAPALLTSQLDELYGSDRQKAAIAALDWKGSNKSVALGVLREIDEFYGNDRTHVIHHVIDGPHFRDARVQQACLQAVRDELYGTTKRKTLTRMLKMEGLDEKVRRVVIAELED